jgi:hypothetical protein
MKFDERNQFFFKSPLSCFHGNCGKVCPTVSEFFSLSRFTRCGCCSYQVSSISVRRVTCYDHFNEFDERNKKKIKITTFLFPLQLRQSLSYWFRFVWLISFH